MLMSEAGTSRMPMAATQQFAIHSHFYFRQGPLVYSKGVLFNSHSVSILACLMTMANTRLPATPGGCHWPTGRELFGEIQQELPSIHERYVYNKC